MRRVGTTAVALAIVLGISGVAGAASKRDEKAYKAFLTQLSGVQSQVIAVKQAALQPDASALDAPCTQLGQVVTTAQATKRPKLVKAAVWSHVQSGYSHYQAAAANCLKHAPATSFFADAIHELSLGNQEIRTVQQALHL